MKNILTLFMIACVCTATAQTKSNQEKIKKDIEFAQKAAESALMEIKLGELAQTNSVTPEVKIHAQHMIEDHRKANEELKSIAGKKNITLPTSLSEKKQRQYDKLARLNGKDFDKKYSKCMIKNHKKDIHLFEKEAKRGEDPELKAWASEKISTLKSHLTMWKEACKAVKR